MSKHQQPKKIYISGQITGLPMVEAMMNFAKAETYLIHKGFDVVSPMSLTEHDAIAKLPLRESERWLLHMKVDIKALMDCTDIFMLSNWGNSKGAKIERDIAIQLGFNIHHQ